MQCSCPYCLSRGQLESDAHAARCSPVTSRMKTTASMRQLGGLLRARRAPRAMVTLRHSSCAARRYQCAAAPRQARVERLTIKHRRQALILVRHALRWLLSYAGKAPILVDRHVELVLLQKASLVRVRAAKRSREMCKKLLECSAFAKASVVSVRVGVKGESRCVRRAHAPASRRSPLRGKRTREYF